MDTQPATKRAGAKVLLIEDDDNLASVYISHFQSAGLAVKRLAGDEDAAQAAQSYEPDAIVLDINPQRVNPLQLIANLRKSFRGKIVMISARATQADALNAKQYGADYFWVKSQMLIPDVATQLKKIV